MPFKVVLSENYHVNTVILFSTTFCYTFDFFITLYKLILQFQECLCDKKISLELKLRDSK